MKTSISREPRFYCQSKVLTLAPDTINCPSVTDSVTNLSEQAAAGRDLVQKRCSYRKPLQCPRYPRGSKNLYCTTGCNLQHLPFYTGYSWFVVFWS